MTQPRTTPLILNVDDDEAGRYVVTRDLRRGGYEVLESGSGAEALELAASARPDLVLLDVRLPDIDGFEVCRRLKAEPATASIPVLHLSASCLDAHSQARGLNTGADGYLTEPVDPEVLHATVRALLRMKAAEQAERTAAQEWQTTFDAIADGVAILDDQGTILRANRALGIIVDRPHAELVGEPWFDLFPDQPAEFSLEVMRTSDKRKVLERAYHGKHLRISYDLICGEQAEVTGCVATASDVSEWSRLQEMLQQSQKLEGIGLLAGGVAHDFNNLLTGILGNTILALKDVPPSSTGYLHDVIHASECAVGLVRQLLDYAGKGRHLIGRTDLADLVRNLLPLIQPRIPRNVALVLDFEPDLPPVEGDAAQLNQVVMNLVINGAEAIGDASGTVRVRLRAQHLDGADVSLRYHAAGQVGSGQFVVLEVSDSGCGMDEATQARIFDPFFTTKVLGRGLGLAGVLGIVRQHGGGIRVQSTPGRGTTFEVVIPSSAAKPAQTPARAASRERATLCSVLVIDDTAVVRSVTKAMLERAGYRVMLANSGKQGVQLFSQWPEEFSLVLLDLNMPGMGGEEAMGHLLRLRPNAKVLIISGSDESEVLRRFGNSKFAGFLQKPFSPDQLIQKVREILDR